jgi:FkbM family methyltransferase
MLACSLAGQGVIGCTDAPTTTEKTHARPASDARPLPAPAGAGEAERGAPELTPLDQVTVVAGEIVEIRGSKMVLDPEDTVVSRVLKRDGIWEPMETELMERELREGDVVVDAGANLGYYTLLAARKVGPNGRVFAFEPEPRAFALLQRNVALNGLTNVTLIPKALGRAPGSLKLYLAPRNHGDHRVYDPSGKRASIDVEVVRLDLALRELGAGRVDFMKIDTQGADCAILEGAGDLLDTSRELAIVLEFTPSALITVGDDPRACLERLTALGFDLVDIREWDRELVATDVEALLARYPASDPKRFTNLFLPRRARN